MIERVLVLLALAAPATAQFDYFDAVKHIPWPAGLTGAKGHMVAGDVTGDLLPDLVLLHAGTPVVVYGPTVYRSVFALALTDANDLVLLPDPTPGQAQRLMVVADDGLHRIKDYDAGDFVDEVLEFTGDSDWVGATRITRGDTDGDGNLDLVGLSADNALLFLEDVDTSPVHGKLSIVPTVLDIAPLDWEGSGTMAVAILQSNGFRVRTRAGNLLYSIPGSPENGHVVPLRQDGLGRDRCVVIWEYDGERYLAVADEEELETPIDITSFAVHGVVAADVNGDGDDDLFLVSHTSHTAKLLINRKASESFTFENNVEGCESIVLAPDSPPSGATPWPVACDLSLDGDVDLALFLEASADIVLLENQSLAVEDSQPTDPGGAFVHDENTHEGELLLAFDLAAGPWTHLQATAWTIVETQTGQEIDPEAYHNGCSAIQPNDQASTHILFPGLQDLEDLDFGLAIDVRWVVMDGDDVVQAGPSSVHFFAMAKETVEEYESQFQITGTDLRVCVIESFWPFATTWLEPAHLTERELAPKEVKAPEVPPPPLPPDPWP